jgi:alpha-L-arabinofuranosidase
MAQNVNVTVNATQAIRTVDERVFGANSVIWDPESSTQQTVGLLNAAGMRTIRVPGGSLSDEYHWRVNKTLSNTWTWSSHFGKFVNLIANLGANAMVTVNYGTGTPEEAAGLVAYLNSPVGSNVAIGTDSKGYNWQNSGTWAAVRAGAPLGNDESDFLRIGRDTPLGAKYFEIGNECYGSWETDQQTVAHDPTTYANRAQQYMAKMKAVDPTIKIGVVVVRSDENGSYSNWTPTMLARLKVLGAIPDFVIYHRYPQGPGGETDAGLLQQAAGNTSGWAYTATDLRNQITANLGASGAGVEVVVTENNSVYSNPGKQSTSIVNGLYLADSIANVMKTEINGFMWWAIRNGPPPTATTNQSASLYGWRMYGDYGMISTPFTEGATTYASNYYTPYPTYYAMKLLQYFARGGDTVVAAASSSNLLSVFAARRADGSLALLILNKDPVNTLNASIALTGYAPGATATVYSYGKPQDTGGADIAMSTLSVSGATFTASFGSYSMTVLSFPTSSPPAISGQPTSQTAVVGSPVTFTVTASGTPAPSYQWRKNGVNIPDATGAAYTILNVGIADAGTYTVLVSNSGGSVISDGAVLAVAEASGDFNGDGKADILWSNATTGERSMWFMNGSSAAGGYSLGIVPAEWVVSGTGDYNGDGKADILLTNTTTGDRAMWLMNGKDVVLNAFLSTVPVNWTVSGNADFNGDGRADVLWTNDATGDRAIWLMNGAAIAAGSGYLATIPVEWKISGTGDFNGDGKADILWTNASTGERSMWFMDGAVLGGGMSLGTVPVDWAVSATADFNGDGKADILWTNTTTGDRAIWLMNGSSVSLNAFAGTVPVAWVVSETADFNGDGKADILWTNTATGDRAIWLMNGTTVAAGSGYLATVPVEWKIAK